MTAVDVLICGLKDGAQTCKDTLEKSGLSVVIASEDQLRSMHAATYIVSDAVSIAHDDAHVIIVENDTADEGVRAAYEALSELFDDSEPADEI